MIDFKQDTGLGTVYYFWSDMSHGLFLPGAPPQPEQPMILATPINDVQLLALVAAQQIHLSEDDAVERAVYLFAAALVAVKQNSVIQKAREIQGNTNT